MNFKSLTNIFLAFAVVTSTGCAIPPLKSPDIHSEPALSDFQRAKNLLNYRQRSYGLERLMDRLSIQSFQMYGFIEQMDAEDCEDFQSTNLPERAEALRGAFEKTTSEEINLGGETIEGRHKRLKEFYDAYNVSIGNYNGILEACEYK